MAAKKSKNGNILGRPMVENSMKRKGRPISMSDHEYNRALLISKKSNMTFSEQVRHLFDLKEQKMIKDKEI